MPVTLEERWGGDLKTIQMLRRSVDRRETEMTPANVKRLRGAMRDRHASPFEASGMTVLAEVPKPIAWQWMRHRTQAYSEMSTRYVKMQGDTLDIYLPEPDHIRMQPAKVGEYDSFELASPELAEKVRFMLQSTYDVCSSTYDMLLEWGIARETARNALPVAFITRFYATASLRNWLNFLNLRTAPHAEMEFRDAAADVEAIIKTEFPHTHEAWCDFGRGQM